MHALQHQDGENSDQTAAAQEEANTLIVECILSLLIEEEVASSIRKPRISLGNNPVTCRALMDDILGGPDTVFANLDFTSRFSILQSFPTFRARKNVSTMCPVTLVSIITPVSVHIYPRRYPYLPPSVSIFTPSRPPVDIHSTSSSVTLAAWQHMSLWHRNPIPFQYFKRGVNGAY
ncbi:uncharacterized protein CPUR_08837 [Claviceps purpurea 20.1]|uniref:Uncharacterized protein n=1 Tax=Claviceps purpurea (strain 20.1) TaxID=1111077 RepID=M1WGW4_CLAP2|nr:uncharacterized protein CPUR_08837 [Claviceps purpurea 20.1]